MITYGQVILLFVARLHPPPHPLPVAMALSQEMLTNLFDKQSVDESRLEASMEKKIQDVTWAFKEEIKSANEATKKEIIDMMDAKIEGKFQSLATDVGKLKASLNAVHDIGAPENKRARSVGAPMTRTAATSRGNLLDRALRLSGFPGYFHTDTLRAFVKTLLGEHPHEKMLIRGQKSDEVTVVFGCADDMEKFWSHEVAGKANPSYNHRGQDVTLWWKRLEKPDQRKRVYAARKMKQYFVNLCSGKGIDVTINKNQGEVILNSDLVLRLRVDGQRVVRTWVAKTVERYSVDTVAANADLDRQLE